jgi:hypothetical protein
MKRYDHDPKDVDTYACGSGSLFRVRRAPAIDAIELLARARG